MKENSLRELARKIIPHSLWYVLKRNRSRILYPVAKIKTLLHLPLHRKSDKLGFSIRVAEHCNLNCKACNNFAPIAEPELISLDELKQDLSRLREIFGDRCSYIDLNGGEALLHPELKSIMKLTRDIFPECIISILTNAVLLPKMDDEFWKTCRDYRIDICASAYPVKLDVDAIRAKAKAFGVIFTWLWNEKDNQRNEFQIEPINLAGNNNVRMNFAMCGRANKCIYLMHGRLYTCSFAVTIRHFNKYFKQNINITDEDSINIYDDLSADDILQRLAEPIQLCRYCNLKTRSVEWGISKREMSEWV